MLDGGASAGAICESEADPGAQIGLSRLAEALAERRGAGCCPADAGRIVPDTVS